MVDISAHIVNICTQTQGIRVLDVIVSMPTIHIHSGP